MTFSDLLLYQVKSINRLCRYDLFTTWSTVSHCIRKTILQLSFSLECFFLPLAGFKAFKEKRPVKCESDSLHCWFNIRSHQLLCRGWVNKHSSHMDTNKPCLKISIHHTWGWNPRHITHSAFGVVTSTNRLSAVLTLSSAEPLHRPPSFRRWTCCSRQPPPPSQRWLRP